MTFVHTLLPIGRVALASFALASAAALGCSDDEAVQRSASSSSSSAGGAGGQGGDGAGGQGGGAQGGVAQGGGGHGGSAVFGGDRPVEVFVPSSYAAGTPVPLLVLLHGFSASGAIHESYFQLQALAESRGFLYAHPDGTKNSQGYGFWNATDACCDFEATHVDDSAYLRQLVDDIKAHYDVDPKRVFFVGHSNGGFMSYRMACEHADTIAAIVSLAGATYADASRCNPTSPVAVLQIHGTDDETISYNGGTLFGGGEYPSAETTVADWVALDGCSSTPTSGPTRDLVSTIAGSETTSQIFDGCEPGGHVELWSVAGGVHVPVLTPAFAPAIVDFLFAHPKP
jgi:polyhydroxybutyrate depolymerase